MPDGGLLSRVIHVFDYEGDIAEVFAFQRKNKNTGVLSEPLKTVVTNN